MTTMAWDGRVLAADSRVTAGDTIITDYGVKVWRHFNESNRTVRLVGCTGRTDDAVEFSRWVKMGCSPSEFPQSIDANEFAAIVVEKSELHQRAYSFQGKSIGVLIPEGDKYAIGSGKYHAMTAFDMGLDALHAVALGIMRDTCSGGSIQFVTAEDSAPEMPGLAGCIVPCQLDKGHHGAHHVVSAIFRSSRDAIEIQYLTVVDRLKRNELRDARQS